MNSPNPRLAIPAFLLAVAAIAAGCNDTTLEPVCGTGYPTIDVDPQTPFLQVHDTLTLSARFNGCGLTRPGVWRWRTSSSAVVSVDTVTGRMTGVAEGQAMILVTDSADRSQNGFVNVQVTAPLSGG